MENQQNQYLNEVEEQEIKISDYINIIIRFKWAAILIFLVVMAGTIIFTANADRIYQASSKILLEERSTSNFLMPSFTNTSSNLNNNIHILKSRPVIQLTYQILAQLPLFKTLPIAETTSPVGYIRRGLSVETERETDLLFIHFESTNPVEAKEVANALANALKRQDTNYARTEFRNTRIFLSTQLEDQERKLQSAEEDLRLYKIENGVSLLSEETVRLIEQSSNLEAMLSQAVTELSVADNHLKFLKGELSDQDSLLTDVNSVLNTPFLAQLKQEIVQKQAQYVNYLTKSEYNETHPELITLKNSIDNAKNKLDAEIKRTLSIKAGSSDPLIYRSSLIENISNAQIEQNIKTSKVKSLKKAVENYDVQMSVLPDTEIELARLERDTKINEKIYSMLIEKFENAKIVEKSKIGLIRIVEEALAPNSPIKPNVKMNILIGLILSIGLGIGVALFLHSVDSKIRTFDDVRKYVNIPILGTIPFINVSDDDLERMQAIIEDSVGEEKKNLTIIQRQMRAKLITNYAPKSSISEAFRILRTSIISKRKNTDSLSILVSSAGPKEGKSLIISNLAITLAQMDAKVVLVDLDLRRPMQHKLFYLEKENGVNEYMTEDNANITDYIKKTKIKNLDLITCGIIPPNPSELLASTKMMQTIKQLKEEYDYVLIDSPPVIAVTDSMVLAKQVDIVALIVMVRKVDKKVIRRTKELLNNININITGAIINGIKPHSYYSNYEYNYYYYYYYGDEDNKSSKPKLLRKD